MTRQGVRLGHCSAMVYDHTDENYNPIIIQKINGVEIVINKYVYLKSYASIVAIVDTETEHLYLLPRWDYSRTTHQHVRKFVREYNHLNECYQIDNVRKELDPDISLCAKFAIDDGYSLNWRVY